jgi:hypothetical protein
MPRASILPHGGVALRASGLQTSRTASKWRPDGLVQIFRMGDGMITALSPAELSAMDARKSSYHDVYARWQHDPEGFWGEAAQEIDWIEPAKRVFDPDAGIYGRWFVGGVCNTCWNAVDRHVVRGRGEQPAIIYDSPLTGQKRTFTYRALQVETQVLAAILRNLGVEKGDRRKSTARSGSGGGSNNAGL